MHPRLRLLLCPALLSACNLAHQTPPPIINAPTHWQHAQEGNAVIDQHWWQAFGSTQLNSLIAEALRSNNDLEAGKQRVEQARAQALIAGAPLWPMLSLGANVNAERSQQGNRDQQTGSFSIAYEVDLWGSNRARRAAGAALALSENAALAALQLVITAEVTQNYFTLSALDQRQRIAEHYQNSVADTLTIIQARFKAGAVSKLDVLQQQTELATARANLALLKQQVMVAANSLAILLGRPPQRADFKIEPFTVFTPPQPIATQPASLLQRRPDLHQIEMTLTAAQANITVARAAFYPRLQLNLEPLASTAQPGSVALTLLAGLTQPIFQGGQLQGEWQRTLARHAELLANYRQTLLTALTEVENAALTRQQASLREQALNQAVQQARAAYQLSQTRYQVGLIDYPTLLNTQRSLLNAENNQIQAQLDVLIAAANLYKALGGGWEHIDHIPCI